MFITNWDTNTEIVIELRQTGANLAIIDATNVMVHRICNVINALTTFIYGKMNLIAIISVRKVSILIAQL
jgi:hypothetical protein